MQCLFSLTFSNSILSFFSPTFSSNTSNWYSPQSPCILLSPFRAFVRFVASELNWIFNFCKISICVINDEFLLISSLFVFSTFSWNSLILLFKGCNNESISFLFCSWNFSEFFSKILFARFSNSYVSLALSFSSCILLLLIVSWSPLFLSCIAEFSFVKVLIFLWV